MTSLFPPAYTATRHHYSDVYSKEQMCRKHRTGELTNSTHELCEMNMMTDQDNGAAMTLCPV